MKVKLSFEVTDGDGLSQFKDAVFSGLEFHVEYADAMPEAFAKAVVDRAEFLLGQLKKRAEWGPERTDCKDCGVCRYCGGDGHEMLGDHRGSFEVPCTHCEGTGRRTRSQ